MKIEQLYIDNQIIRQGYRHCLSDLIDILERGSLKNKKEITLFLKACLQDVRLFIDYGERCLFKLITNEKGKLEKIELKDPSYSALAEKKAKVASLLIDIIAGGGKNEI